MLRHILPSSKNCSSCNLDIALDHNALSIILEKIAQAYLLTPISVLQHHPFSNKPNDMSKGHNPLRRSLFLSLWAADSIIYVNVLRKRLAVSAFNTKGVLFQAGVSEVFLIAIFVRGLPEMTRQHKTIFTLALEPSGSPLCWRCLWVSLAELWNGIAELDWLG